MSPTHEQTVSQVQTCVPVTQLQVQTELAGMAAPHRIH